MFALESSQFTLEALSPVHIGTGDTLDPQNYVAFDEEHNGVKHYGVEIYDISKAIQLMPAAMRAKLEDFVARNNHVELRRWLADQFLCEDVLASSCLRLVRADAELVTTYKRELNQEKSSLEIHPLVINSVTQKPIIPGSSIKGAFRTAWLNHLVSKRGIKKEQRALDRFEREMLGEPQQDMFRSFTVADVEMPYSGFITQIFNVRKGGEVVSNSPSGKTFRMYFETLCSDAKKPMRGNSRIAWSTRPELRREFKGEMPETLEALLAALRADAQRELSREAQFFGNHSAGIFANKLLTLLKGFSAKEALIKIGRFGGVYSKTLENIREPRTRKGRDDRLLPWGTTRYIAAPGHNAESVSCGWCKIVC